MKSKKVRSTITIIGVGGYMGTRIFNNLVKTDYNLLLCGRSSKGVAHIIERGLSITAMEEAVPQSDFIIIAVPDRLLGKISHDVVPRMKSGSTFILLDPAAAFAKEIALRDDCTFVVVHPCHPSLLAEYTTPEEQADRIGGEAAKQDIVIALLQGTEKNFKIAEEISRQMFAPVEKAYKVTVEQMALLEPAMAEVAACTFVICMKEATDEAIKRGVPEEAAYSFMLGHINEVIWSVFTNADTISEAAYKAIDYGMEEIIKKDWKHIFDEKSLKEVIHRMLHPNEL